MDINQDTLKREIEELKQLRDELRVQAHLAKAEAKDLWVRLESVWPKVEHRLVDLEHETESAKDHIATATRLLIQELKDGYQQLAHHD